MALISSIFLPYSAGGAEAVDDDALGLLSVVLLLAALALGAFVVLADALDAGFLSVPVEADFARAGFFAAVDSLASVFFAAGFFFGPAASAFSGLFALEALEADFGASELLGLLAGLGEEGAGPPRKSITPPTFGSATF